VRVGDLTSRRTRRKAETVFSPSFGVSCEKVITSGKPLATRASMAQRVLTFVVVGLGHMPDGRKAPAMVQPSGLPAGQVRNEIGAELVAMTAIIAQCEARFGRHVKLLDHPILGPLTPTQWRKLHLVHGRHHQKQLLRLRESATRQCTERGLN
jgi:hypothetical protein